MKNIKGGIHSQRREKYKSKRKREEEREENKKKGKIKAGERIRKTKEKRKTKRGGGAEERLTGRAEEAAAGGGGRRLIDNPHGRHARRAPGVITSASTHGGLRPPVVDIPVIKEYLYICIHFIKNTFSAYFYVISK